MCLCYLLIVCISFFVLTHDIGKKHDDLCKIDSMKGSGDIFWHKKPYVESLLNHNFENFKDDAFLGVNEFVGITYRTFPLKAYIYKYIYYIHQPLRIYKQMKLEDISCAFITGHTGYMINDTLIGSLNFYPFVWTSMCQDLLL